MDEGKDYSLGHMRAKYLDLANMSFVIENTTECARQIDNFIDLLDENKYPEAAKQLTEEFDRIELNIKIHTQQLLDEIKEMGELEKTDIKNQGEKQILIEGLHDKKIVCWNIAMKHGLFYE